MEREKAVLAGELDPRWDGASIPFDHWHFHRRLLERYGIIMAPGEFSRVLNLIRAGKAQIIERKSNGAAIVTIRLRQPTERVYLVVRGHRIVTVLPPTRALNRKRQALKLRSDCSQTPVPPSDPA